MKLKLRTNNIESLKLTLSLISLLRKHVILQFDPENLLIILTGNSMLSKEPHVWCKLLIKKIFDQVEIQSLKNSTIQLEINVDLFLQTLKNFDKANSDGLSIRLQRKESDGNNGTNGSRSRTASMALFYSHVNINQNTVNHLFRIPVKILKNNQSSNILKEPILEDLKLVIRLPREFSAIHKRLEKFKKVSVNELIQIQASRKNGGLLKFLLEDGNHKVTLSWNNKLEVLKPNQMMVDTDSLTLAAFEPDDENSRNNYNDDVDDGGGDVTISVKLKDWQMSSKIVANCHTVVLMLTGTDCIIHGLLDEEEEAQIIYYITGMVIRNPLED